MSKKRNKYKKWRAEGSFPKIGDVYSKTAMRVDRSRTWNDRAEEIATQMFDVYAVYIFKWIAFTCLYDSLSGEKHKPRMENFVLRCCENDTENVFYEAVKNNSQLLVDFVRKTSPAKNKEKQSEKLRKHINSRNTEEALLAVFSHLYLCRNEIMHGQKPWGTSERQPAIRDAYKILDMLLPLFHRTMKD